MIIPFCLETVFGSLGANQELWCLLLITLKLVKDRHDEYIYMCVCVCVCVCVFSENNQLSICGCCYIFFTVNIILIGTIVIQNRNNSRAASSIQFALHFTETIWGKNKHNSDCVGAKNAVIGRDGRRAVTSTSFCQSTLFFSFTNN
jgi:hypothetical protein